MPRIYSGMRNSLFCGDSLDMIRDRIADGSVDLVGVDPPFNSARDYNVLFKQAKQDEFDFPMGRSLRSSAKSSPATASR